MPGNAAPVIAVAALIAALGVGCSSGSSGGSAPKVGTPGGTNAITTTIPKVRSSQVWSFGSVMICAEKPSSPVVITLVSLPKNSHGLRVVDFGTRPNPFLNSPPGQSFGVVTGAVATHHITGRTVDRCLPPRTGTDGDETATTEFVVALARSGAATGSTGSVVVHYTSAGRTGTSSVPEGATLCAPADRIGYCGR